MRSLHTCPGLWRSGKEGNRRSCVRARWQGLATGGPIYDRWTFDLWWLPEPVSRAYYRIDPGDDRWMTLFRDQRDDRWYRQSA